jgi:hypothetical protein
MPQQDTAEPAASFFSLQAIGINVARMTLLWLALGIMVGMLSSPFDEGIVRIVAGIIAGMIICPLIGAFLGLIGAQWRETLMGAIAGLGLGFCLGVASGVAEVRPLANVSMVGGALVGATFLTYLTYARKFLAAILR